jgi:hypothetical protein
MKITSVTDANGAITTTVENDTTVDSSQDFSSQLNEQLSTTSSLEAIFQKAADKYGVDETLLKAIAKAESGFDASATSKSGAMGIMQLMPGTAKTLGVSDAYDPEQNIMGGAKLISSLLKKYDGNVSYALAAYNAGSGNVDKYGGIPPFEETQNYVTKILGYLQDGDVEIPDQYTTVSTTKAASADSSGSTESSDVSLSDALKALFTEQDYEDFLRLFLERLTERLEEKAAGTTTASASVESESEDVEAEQEEQQDSDAYIAFRNFGNTNRMAVYLKPSEE